MLLRLKKTFLRLRLLRREETLLRLRLLFSFGPGHTFRFGTGASDFAFHFCSLLNAERFLVQDLPLASRGVPEFHLVAFKAAGELTVDVDLVFCLDLAAEKFAGYLHVSSGADIASAHYSVDLDAAAPGIDVPLVSAFDEDA